MFNQINALATNKQQTVFAVGDITGQVIIFKDIFNPKLQYKIKTSSKITKLSFSPYGNYLAVFSKDNCYVYDLENPKNRFKMYEGFYKEDCTTFHNNWSKAYVLDGVGEVIVFDQSYIVNKNKFREKIIDCEKIISSIDSDSRSLIQYIEDIENILK
ncbi:hypothetical protein [Candidatus Uabimicrobium sp. HlEnr_7]|uniref:hypothetical protein n=1 Tax=Candidatus Uabimicrobium helgolandensis TaxID=3095367 RepID=UPI003557F761